MAFDGDYEQRHRGLANLMRPRDVFRYDRWRAEACSGVVSRVPPELRVGYAIMRARAEWSLGAVCTGVPGPHPMMYLWSCLRYHKTTHFPPLVETAYSELKHERTLSAVFREANHFIRAKAQTGPHEN